MSTETDLDQVFESLFASERQLRALREKVTEEKPDQVFAAISRHLKTARALGETPDAELRLGCLAMLLGDQGGSRSIELLIDILTYEQHDAREVAAEQLQMLAESRFRDFSKAVERALERLPVGSPALTELPFVLGDIPDDGIIPLLRRFLKHADAHAVAAAVEVSLDLEEPSLLDAVKTLENDTRPITVIGDDDEPLEITLGELVKDAMQAIEEELAPFADDLRKS